MTHKNDYMEKDYDKYKSPCNWNKRILTDYGNQLAIKTLSLAFGILIGMACFASIYTYFAVDKMTKLVHTINSSTTTINK